MQRMQARLRRFTGTWRGIGGAALAVGALGAALWWSATSGHAQEGTNARGGKETFEVKSGQLIVDDQLQKARFEGQVAATWGEWTLRCEALDVTYSQDGQVLEATATGSPIVLTWSGGLIEAKRAHFTPRISNNTPPNESLTEGTVWLEGDPVLRRGQSKLTGERVEVDLRSRRVKVLGVSGVLAPEDF